MQVYINESNGDVMVLKQKTNLNILFSVISNDEPSPLVLPLMATKPLKEMNANEFVTNVLKKYEKDANSITKKELNTLYNLGYERTVHTIDSAI
jgi:hypothetical protein